MDLFKISNRIKDIDPQYEIRGNKVFWRGKFAFVNPFDYLDERLLVYTRKTRRENADEIEREIDEANAKIERDKQKNISELKTKIKDYVKYDFERIN